ncbi:MAG TPA: MFS transporter [Sporolactobacillaceae bacterium]|nr:MFS transporter [Sporolactobacillaceae bacterium]
MNQKPTRVRLGILLLLFVSVVINYMDRSNISIAAPLLGKDLKLDSVHMGLIFSAFGWAYAILQIPGGFVLDKIGSRFMYLITLGLWSLATLLQGTVKGFGALFGLRLGLGVFEAPAFPTNNRVVTTWFPEKERASAIGFYTSGQFVGLAFLTPVLVYLQTKFGWQSLFYITGVIGIVWAIIWVLLYRDPGKSKRINQAELDYIREGGGLADSLDKKESQNKAKFSDLKYVFKSRKLWGVFLGQFAVTSTLWFFLTWFPTYLVKYRGLDFIKAGFLSSLPFLAAFVGVLLSGFISDFLIRRGATTGTARKTPVILGLLLSICIVGANFVNSPALIILFMTIAFLGNGLASITWVFVSTLSPAKLVGVTGGVFNFVGNLSGIIIPLVIGFLVKGGSFAPAIIFIAVIALCGALSYIFLVGKVERIATEEEKKIA